MHSWSFRSQCKQVVGAAGCRSQCMQLVGAAVTQMGSSIGDTSDAEWFMLADASLWMLDVTIFIEQ